MTRLVGVTVIEISGKSLSINTVTAGSVLDWAELRCILTHLLTAVHCLRRW